jgi:hypothetical protein
MTSEVAASVSMNFEVVRKSEVGNLTVAAHVQVIGPPV